MISFVPRLVGIGSVKLIRNFHGSSGLRTFQKGAYEGEGKTTVTILNKDSTYGLMIDTFTQRGFKLNNGLWIFGSVIVFPRSVLGWHIKSADDINENSLALFKVLEPTLDILVLGLDKKYGRHEPFIERLKVFTRKQGINLEILQTEHAITTFNYLNAEHRYVAAALMPPSTLIPKQLQAFNETIARRRMSQPEPEKLSGGDG